MYRFVCPLSDDPHILKYPLISLLNVNPTILVNLSLWFFQITIPANLKINAEPHKVYVQFFFQKFKQRCLQPNSHGFSRNRYPDASQSLPVLVWLLVFCPETGDCSLETFSRQEYGQLSLGECYGLLHSQGFSMLSGKSVQRNKRVFKACRQILYKKLISCYKHNSDNAIFLIQNRYAYGSFAVNICFIAFSKQVFLFFNKSRKKGK